MFFFPRNSAIVILAIVGAVLVMAAFDVPGVVFGALGAAVFVVLLLGVVLDRYSGPKR